MLKVLLLASVIPFISTLFCIVGENDGNEIATFQECEPDYTNCFTKVEKAPPHYLVRLHPKPDITKMGCMKKSECNEGKESDACYYGIFLPICQSVQCCKRNFCNSPQYLLPLLPSTTPVTTTKSDLSTTSTTSSTTMISQSDGTTSAENFVFVNNINKLIALTLVCIEMLKVLLLSSILSFAFSLECYFQNALDDVFKESYTPFVGLGCASDSGCADATRSCEIKVLAKKFSNSKSVQCCKGHLCNSSNVNSSPILVAIILIAFTSVSY
ncbi:hypothetical protein PRIPAC_87578 [Pristionchus pacificus]|uniref:Uncharacterized protein n=1 Tax=Pristionchus pacificus TaxID=54126 RepID=A0A2A6B673_PRIPA|nr:hypothetical protein PRIPAC_87578 [Pristionchus pacificus]|eukprot:PDM61380.1 hypothetical protein PRIPAC_50822 [Pristionchus pacificus]